MDITGATKGGQSVFGMVNNQAGTTFQTDRTNITAENPDKTTPSTGSTMGTPGAVTTQEDEEYDGNLMLQSYMQFLKERDVTKDNILAALEHIITSGGLEWGSTILNKVKVRFRMRPAWVENIISEEVDKVTTSNPNISMMHFSNIVRVANLAGSLVQYGDKIFKMDTPADYDTAYDFVSKMAYPIVAKICEQLAIFDRVVAVAMSDWAMKNFMEPPKENS